MPPIYHTQQATDCLPLAIHHQPHASFCKRLSMSVKGLCRSINESNGQVKYKVTFLMEVYLGT